jgi:hypothetical protein
MSLLPQFWSWTLLDYLDGWTSDFDDHRSSGVPGVPEVHAKLLTDSMTSIFLLVMTG